MLTYPNAKINLGLNVTEKRPDGYHNLETIFYPIALHDTLHVEKLEIDSEIILHQTGNIVDGNPADNLVVKAYWLLKKDFPAMTPVQILLDKHIPSGAGLGGGSSDAAFMIKMLNESFNLKLTEDAMESYASLLGADCAFFVRNRPVFASGIGNIFEEISLTLKGYSLVLVKPNDFVSTKEAYANICPKKPFISLKEIIRQPVNQWRSLMENDFEKTVFVHHPAISHIKEKLYEIGAEYAAMSGSGSAVYGIFRRRIENVEQYFENIFCCQMEMEY